MICFFYLRRHVIALKNIREQIPLLWSKIRAKKPAEILKLICVNFFGLWIVFILYLIKPFKTVKLLEIRSRAIGQQAGNTGLFLRRLQRESEETKHKVLYVGISGKPDNKQLLKMFKRKFPIIESDLLARICGDGAFLIRWTGFYQDLPFHANEFEFDDTEPGLKFTPQEETEGRMLLNKMGIDEASWFVCFHNRDPAFPYSYVGDYRNCNIHNYLEAAKYITSCGGFALRMGHTVSGKLPDSNNTRIIDYASEFRTDFGDIFLSAKCKFFLGSSAGLVVVPAIFNVPIAAANFIPFGTTWRTGDLFIPMKIWSVEERRLLSFREYIEFAGDIRGGDIREGVDSNIFAHYRIAGGKYIVIENTAEEILDLAMEMNERLDGTYKTTEEDEELQQIFQSLLHPDDFFYGTPARIGAKFLRQNKALLM